MTEQKTKKPIAITPKYNFEKPSEAVAPSDFMTNPIFAAEKQDRARAIKCADGTTWVIGTQDPTRKDFPVKSFDVRHAELIFSLIAFFRQNFLDFNKEINLSFNQLLKIMNKTKSNKSFDLVKELVYDLYNIWVEIKLNDTEALKFKILNASSIHMKYDPNDKDKVVEECLRGMSFHPKFTELLENIEKRLYIRLDIFDSLTSKLAKAIYLYIPSRAIHYNSKEDSFKITMKNVLEQLGESVPEFKSVRHKKFVQARKDNSIISQLDNALLSLGKKLRVSIEDTSDGSDYNLCFWVEPTRDIEIIEKIDSKLKEWYIQSGGTAEDFHKLIINPLPLDSYEEEKLSEGGLNLKQTKRFLEMTKALMPDFKELCGEFAYLSQSRDRIWNPTAYFIGMVRRNLTGELFADE